MPNRIQGITVEIGGDTQGLSKALSGVNREIRTTQSQLKDVERLLKLDPGNTELLRQKYELLNDSIESTEEKLDSLREAEKQVQQQFERGEVSQDQYNGLQREIIATEQALGRLQNEARDTENRINGIDEKPIEQVEDAAEDAGDALRDAGDDASHFGDMLKAGAIVEGVSGLVDSMSQLADETREYQRIMGSLEVSSERAGYSAEETADTYRQLYGVLGDDQTAATTTANLQALGFAQEDLKDLTNAAIGAWATYGDSIPIDGLAESINETIQAGQVTGNFADVLNWAGTNEDDFNAKLENAADSTERANIVMEELARQGLVEAGEAWQKNNESLVESNQAAVDFQDTMAEMSERVLPVLTSVKQGITDLLNSLLEVVDGGDFSSFSGVITRGLEQLTETVIPSIISFLREAIPKIVEVIPEIATAVVKAISSIGGQLLAAGISLIEYIAEGIENGLPQLASSIPHAIETVVGSVSNNIPGLLEKGVQIANSLINGFISAIPNLIQGLPSIISTISTFVTTSIPYFIQAGAQVLQNLVSGIVTALPLIIEGLVQVVNVIVLFFTENAPQLLEQGIQLVQNLISGIVDAIPMLLEALPQIIYSFTTTILENLPSVMDSGKQMLRSLIDGIVDAIPMLLEALPQIIYSFTTTILENLPSVMDSGKQMLRSLIDGILQTVSELVENLPAVIDAVVSFITDNLPTMMQQGVEIILSIITGILDTIPDLISGVGEVVSTIINFISENLPSILKAGIEILKSLISGIIQTIPDLVANLPKIISAIVDGMGALMGSIVNIGANIVHGIWNGISGAAGWLWNQISGFCSNIVNGIKNFFGINSPSKLMEDAVGKWLPPGIAVGFEDAMPKAMREIDASMGDITTAIPQALGYGGNTTTDSHNMTYTFGPGSIVIQTQATDGNALYRQLMVRMQQEVSRKEAAYGRV